MAVGCVYVDDDDVVAAAVGDEVVQTVKEATGD